jgi:FKBP12-rapamycin complex-associated protein
VLQLIASWKDAASIGDTKSLHRIMERLQVHISTWLQDLGVDRPSMETEGLGLRPLLSTQHVSSKTQHVLARRFYRLAQWNEILQGDYWVQDPENEVYRYYSLSYKLDDLWYNAGWSMSQAAMNVFETNGHSRTDQVAVGNYGKPTCPTWMLH